MQTIIATIVKDEASRYWRSALEAWSEFADLVVVFDDDSTDDTRSIAEEFDKVDLFRLIDGQDMWGNEAPHRAALFNYAMLKGETGDVVFWLDADMVPTEDPRPYFQAGGETFAFYLYDLWGKGLYRSDTYWRGHEGQRVWGLRIPKDFDATRYEWANRGLHSGHIPGSWWLIHNGPVVYVPRSCSLLHYGYYTEADRADRHERYVNARRHLTPGELAHAKSIMDPKPTLKKLMLNPKWELERANPSR
jgi:glycosyltransferase involved in cell wall biosynthesis